MTPHEIREIRRQLGMTQGKLASVLGVSVATVQNAERGLKVRERYISDLGRLGRGESIMREDYPPLQLAPFGGEGTDLHTTYTKAQRAVDALYRMARDAQKLNAARVAAAARAPSEPRPSGRMTAVELAQRQADVKAEKQRLADLRLEQRIAEAEEAAHKLVFDLSARWSAYELAGRKDAIALEITGIRDHEEKGNYLRLEDFIYYYQRTGRVPLQTNPDPDCQRLFAPGVYVMKPNS